MCRNELNQGNITSERDYVSNLGTHLRFPFGPFFLTRIAIARTLPQNLETTFGCDSIIIFKRGNKVKVGLFEAKWPRYFSVANYPWDSKNTAGNSRFSSQITRQSNWSNSGAYIWEMFFNESASGYVSPPFDDFGSNCLPHADAFKYMNANKTSLSILWNNQDLINSLPNSMNFRKIIYNILRCRFGEKFDLIKNEFTIFSNDKKTKIQVPVITSIENIDKSPYNEILNSFMEKTGLSHYICLDIEEIEKENYAQHGI
ncbi:hypothetical protein NH341_11210 [Tenacibaculum sp. XPcli2-G]|uniref:hypothetical protein n=1 Tax=Tenacibaculum sp. XPcli2-G TaxID=2954503 RepID=UPI002097990E|nr:hypothetical protein [Tenacibaculum sp. XPcli2-G]MCO7185998.1 hypothetical protein [Tenacibaculum sp. XPcli2-G]